MSSHDIGPQKEKRQKRACSEYQYEKVWCCYQPTWKRKLWNQMGREEMMMMMMMMMMHVCSQSESLYRTYRFDPRVREVMCFLFLNHRILRFQCCFIRVHMSLLICVSLMQFFVKHSFSFLYRASTNVNTVNNQLVCDNNHY